MSSSSPQWTPDIVIRPEQSRLPAELGAVWEARELVYYLVLREIQGRYRATVLGLFWLLARPVLNTLVYTLLFGVVLRASSEGLPYPLFLLAGLAPWNYFANSVQRASTSLADNAHLIRKVYFPRLVLPLACVISGLVDFAGTLLVLFVLMLLYRAPLDLHMIWLPAFIAAAALPALAVSLWVAVLSLRYRDLAHGLGFILQALMYATPIVYSQSAIPAGWRLLYQLNPMAGVVQGTRWALLGIGEPPGQLFAVSLILSLLLLVAGVYFFQHRVRWLVDTL